MDLTWEYDKIKAKKLIIQANKDFERIFQILDEIKPKELNADREKYADVFDGNQRTVALVNQEEDNSSDDSNYSSTDSDDSSSSIGTINDVALITNTHQKAFVPSKKQDSDKENDLIAIGSGATLIHKDKYRTVNWKSYSSATRTLLLAVFSRKILATHCLTGKCSPAFRNKPAKKCLDSKKVSDIIIEITNKFDVKENLVRSIITTKCADECKMFKMRQTNKKEIPTKTKSQ
ncbi:unnamed protein product [Euphydryas editha]|uniref:BEN domain-containing protein n=1 Tax=Euphydryas editha TaxID=104508 RepID=A0AAU9TQX8_EUPED|nr:unnamed protein product [Euphydryas editha]